MDDDKKQAQNQLQIVPSVTRGVERSVAEYSTEKEIQLSDDLKKLGLEAVNDRPQIEPVHEEIGVKNSLETTPLTSQPSKVQLPVIDEAKLVTKTHSVKDAERWEAEVKIREELKKLQKAA